MGYQPLPPAIIRPLTLPLRMHPKEDHPSLYAEGRRVFGVCEMCDDIYELAAGHRCPIDVELDLVEHPLSKLTCDGEHYTELIYVPRGQSNTALLALMKTLEREIQLRVDPKLIGEEYR
jgi:hypothetical protein